MDFQENLLKTLLQIEDSINEAATFYSTEKKLKCLIIYDRGAMDPIACEYLFFHFFHVIESLFLSKYLNKDLQREDWEILKQKNQSWNEVFK